jgi:D-alanyl-lipoteichoic acid acyltransferase DltB (MBOAT superfamily)
LGFRLSENFWYPYFATSIREFWKRWHISLTSWFTEYVYIPLGGNRVSHARWILNIAVVFLLSGFWHGAHWAFIVWGALHAVYYLVEHSCKKRFPALPAFLSGLLVFVLVTVAWVFFRLEDVSRSVEAIAGFFSHPGGFYWGGSAFSTGLAFVFLLLFVALDYLRYRTLPLRPWVSAGGYACLLAMILLFGVNQGGFVYFQF